MGENLLLSDPEFKITDTGKGVWREYLYANGDCYRQYTSHTTVAGMPLLVVANGRDPETGKMAVAEGFVAIGQRAKGVIAIGQLAKGTIAIGQLAFGSVLAVGQFSVAPFGLGQGTIALIGAGQIGIAGYGAFMIGLVGKGLLMFPIF